MCCAEELRHAEPLVLDDPDEQGKANSFEPVSAMPTMREGHRTHFDADASALSETQNSGSSSLI